MTVLQVDSAVFIADMFLCAGLGVWLALLYHVCTRAIRKKSRVLAFVFHIIYFTLAAFAVFLFVLGQTTTKAIRLHIIAGLVLGVVVYYCALGAWVSLAARKIRKTAMFVLAIIYSIYRATLGKLFGKAGAVVKDKVAKPAAAYLHNTKQKVYNSFTKAKARNRKEEDVEHGEGTDQSRTKKAIKAATKT